MYLESKIKRFSSPRELNLRGQEISHLPMLCASATTMGAPGGWTSPSLMAGLPSMFRDGFEQRILVTYYCESKNNLTTTNDYVFCGTGSFEMAAEAVRKA